MTAQLVFTLYAPLGAWGSPSLSAANAAYKATELDPPRSAMLGLLAAALGLTREREAELDPETRLAIRVDIPPTRDPKPDYHTITKARFRGTTLEGRTRWTRFEELRSHLIGGDDSGAILSRREYWTMGLWTVALARTHSAPPTLHVLAAALALPVWPLYAGRKACALGLPPDPEVLDADGPVAAMNAYGHPWTRHPILAGALTPLRQAAAAQTQRRLLFDPDYPGAPLPAKTASRRDRPAHHAPSGVLIRRFLVRTCAESWLPAEGG
jgi:CRISPR system Cascade subunit CasD